MYLSPETIQLFLHSSAVAAAGLAATLALVVRAVDRLNVRLAEIESQLLQERSRRAVSRGPDGATVHADNSHRG
jgi:hypothetical protein